MTNRFGAVAPGLYGWASRAALAALLVCGCLPNAQAQNAKQPWEEYDKLIQSRGVVTAHGTGLFGDKVDLYRGALSFSVTDISLPGNSSLPVALTRTMTVSNRRLYPNQGMLADWDLDLPHLTGVYAPTWAADRCTSTRGPGTAFASSTAYGQDEYWQGVQANMPGGGEMLVANQSAPRPSSGGPYPWMTSAFTYFSCLSSTSGGGEGFLAITSDGTRYWFNHMAQYHEPQLASPLTTIGIPTPHPLSRKRVALYATRVEDRFGNWATYSYSNNSTAPARLSSIQASDGRRITLTYNPQGNLATASNGSQIWRYEYAYPAGGKGTLTAVILPDSNRWSLDLAALSNAEIVFDGEPPRGCGVLNPMLQVGPLIGSVKHPSGAIGEFEVQQQRLGRSHVPKICANWEFTNNNPYDDIAIVPKDMEVLVLERKTLKGPGLEIANWLYGFSSSRSWIPKEGPPICDSEDCLEPDPACVSGSASCTGSTVATVVGPDGRWKRYVFGNVYRYNEGKLLRVEQGEGTAAPLRTETTTYELAQSGQPFATPIGSTLQRRGAGFTSSYLQPLRSKVISQDGTTFSAAYSAFDTFARPGKAVRSSSLGATRTEATDYHDNLSSWIVGQVAKVTNVGTGEVMSQTEYSSTYAQPIRRWSFGQLQHTLGYNLATGTQDGTLSTVTDGRDKTTTLSGWKRGIPQLIVHADTNTESAVVNDDGTIAAVTDENGYRTCYSYDAMGRLKQVVYPSETQAGVCDSSAWNPSNQAFGPMAVSEYGIPAGHWRQTISTGNGHKITYFDALWRPLLVREYDEADIAGTQRFTRFAYDPEGRTVFASYPSTASNPVTGVWTGYDALGRVVRVEQDAEFEAPLVTTTQYLSGFRRQTTNPRTHATIESFTAFDVPTYDMPTQIDAGGVRTVIERDGYGKPLELVRGPGG